MSRKLWTPQDDAVLRRMYPDQTAAACGAALGCTASQIYGRAHKLGLEKSEAFKLSDLSKRIQTGKQSPGMIATRFKPGHASWNRGTKGICGVHPNSVAAQFKKGRKAEDSANYVPLGAERLTKDGYIERKVTDDPNRAPARRWVAVQRLVWEEHHGPIPEGHIVRFINGIKTDVRIENLECITKSENARRNVNNMPPEIRKINQLRGALQRQINRQERKP